MYACFFILYVYDYDSAFKMPCPQRDAIIALASNRSIFNKIQYLSSNEGYWAEITEQKHLLLTIIIICLDKASDNM